MLLLAVLAGEAELAAGDGGIDLGHVGLLMTPFVAASWSSSSSCLLLLRLLRLLRFLVRLFGFWASSALGPAFPRAVLGRSAAWLLRCGASPCASSTDWIEAMAASSRPAISRLVLSSLRERAVSPSSAAASRVRSRPSACTWSASASSLRSACVPALDRGVERIERQRQALDRRIDCTLVGHGRCPGRCVQKCQCRQMFRQRILRAARSARQRRRKRYAPLFSGACAWRPAAGAVTLTPGRHMLSTRRQTGLFHERKRFVDGSRGARRAPATPLPR